MHISHFFFAASEKNIELLALAIKELHSPHIMVWAVHLVQSQSLAAAVSLT
jgi:hypothetical protein